MTPASTRGWVVARTVSWFVTTTRRLDSTGETMVSEKSTKLNGAHDALTATSNVNVTAAKVPAWTPAASTREAPSKANSSTPITTAQLQGSPVRALQAFLDTMLSRGQADHSDQILHTRRLCIRVSVTTSHAGAQRHAGLPRRLQRCHSLRTFSSRINAFSSGNQR